MVSRIEKIILENMPYGHPAMSAKEIWEQYVKDQFSFRGVRFALTNLVEQGQIKGTVNFRKDMRVVYYVRVMKGETKNAVVA